MKLFGGLIQIYLFLLYIYIGKQVCVCVFECLFVCSCIHDYSLAIFTHLFQVNIFVCMYVFLLLVWKLYRIYRQLSSPMMVAILRQASCRLMLLKLRRLTPQTSYHTIPIVDGRTFQCKMNL